MQHPLSKQGIIKASTERLSKVRPGGTCANLPVRGNWCSFKLAKMVQNVREGKVREFESETWLATLNQFKVRLSLAKKSCFICFSERSFKNSFSSQDTYIDFCIYFLVMIKNQTVKFGQLIDYNKGNIFLPKSCKK